MRSHQRTSEAGSAAVSWRDRQVIERGGSSIDRGAYRKGDLAHEVGTGIGLTTIGAGSHTVVGFDPGARLYGVAKFIPSGKCQANWIMPKSMSAKTGKMMANSTSDAPSSSRRPRRDPQDRAITARGLILFAGFIL